MNGDSVRKKRSRSTLHRNITGALARTQANDNEIGELVLIYVLICLFFRLVFGCSTYKTRRGRESNPRIEVLQTPTLPLGYPAA